MKQNKMVASAALILLLTGCGSDSAPEFTVAENGGIEDYTTITVAAPLEEADYKQILEDFKADQDEEGGYYISFACKSDKESVLATARFGIGEASVASTGVEVGDFLVEIEEGATCPN
jgi:hypothetical protein